MITDWTEGQEVVGLPHYSNGNYPPFKRTIRTVKGRKITLDDGTAWTFNGRLWGCGSERWYTGATIYPATPENLDRYARVRERPERATLRYRITKALEREDVPIERLRAALAALGVEL